MVKVNVLSAEGCRINSGHECLRKPLVNHVRLRMIEFFARIQFKTAIILKKAQRYPFENGIPIIKRQFSYMVDQIWSNFTLPGTCERGFTLICKNSEFWGPIYFRNFGSP